MIRQFSCIVLLCVLFLAASAKTHDFRKQKYEPYPPVESTAKWMKTSGYSQFENPTGIWFETGDEVVVTVAKAAKEKLQLRVHNFGPGGEDRTYDLQAGENRLKMEAPGLGYVAYFTDNWKKAKPVKISIEGGKVNGFFDVRENNNEDWKQLLNNSVCEIMDIRGQYVQLAYATASLKKYCPEDGLRLIRQYDSIINTQHELMGLVKYNKRPKNHMFGRVIWNGFMHADGWGAAFHDGTMGGLANPDKVLGDSWGIAHEFGHVNQVRPGMKWVSTTEVTNNIYSAWSQYLNTPHALRLEHERINSGDGNVTGGRFNAYLNNGIVKGQQWLCQQGPDKMKDYENGSDHFVKLCPLWQLQLYYVAAGRGNKDLYPDIFEIVRNSDENNLSNGRLQLNFMKNACDVQKEDLTDFFVKAGMLKPIDKDMDDYSRAQLTITEADCQELIRYASRYPKPASPVIYYISGNCIPAYKDRLPVVGEFGKGVTDKEQTKVISHDVWKNVTVFETYQGDELIKVAMAGTNSTDNSSTLVQYPAGATRIEAVAWDGARKLVFGTR